MFNNKILIDNEVNLNSNIIEKKTIEDKTISFEIDSSTLKNINQFIFYIYIYCYI